MLTNHWLVFSINLFISVNRKVVIELICFLSEYEKIVLNVSFQRVNFHDSDIHIFLDAL